MKPLKTCKVFDEASKMCKVFKGLVRKCFEIPSRGNPKLIYYTTKVYYKMNLAEEIQRDKSRDSSASGITYILEEQSGREMNGSMYTGEGLGLKGSVACRRSTAGFEEVLRFKESSKHSKRL